MKRQLLFVVILALVGCRATLPDDSAIHSIGAFTLDDRAGNNCNLNSTLMQSSGSLDIDLSSSFLLRFDIESSLEPVTQKLERTSSGPDQNDFIINAMVVTYFLGGTPSTTSPYVTGGTQLGNTERVSQYSVVRAGGTLKMGTDLITPQVVGDLRARLSRLDSAQLHVAFVLDGRLASGQHLKSSPVVFPITVYRSGRSDRDCQTTNPTDRYSNTGPCKSRPGQDGSIVACCNGPLRDNPEVKKGCP